MGGHVDFDRGSYLMFRRTAGTCRVASRVSTAMRGPCRIGDVRFCLCLGG